MSSSWFRTAVASLSIVGSGMQPAFATPGQSVPAFQQWAHEKTVLRGLAKTTEEMSGRPAYELTMSDRGVAWAFRATVVGTTIGRESLTVGSDGTATGDAIRHDGSGYGYTFWKTLYGQSVAKDFRDSRSVFSTRDDRNHTTTTYYLGARFGYVSAGGLTLETHAEFATELAQARICSARPDRCPGD
jgi:hypothetical protein